MLRGGHRDLTPKVGKRFSCMELLLWKEGWYSSQTRKRMIAKGEKAETLLVFHPLWGCSPVAPGNHSLLLSLGPGLLQCIFYHPWVFSKALFHQVISISLQAAKGVAFPQTVVHQSPLSWNSPGKNTGVGCHSLLQGIFLPQGSNPVIPHCRHTLPSEPPGSQHSHRPW